MTDGREFEQILREKMSDSREENAHFSPPQPQFSSEVFLPFDPLLELLGLKSSVSTNEKAGFSFEKTPYKNVPRPNFKQKKEEPKRSEEKTVLIANLPASAAKALQTLISLGGTELEGALILGESRLKKCFRRLALELHPDRSKKESSREFRELHENYRTLISSFGGSLKSTSKSA